MGGLLARTVASGLTYAESPRSYNAACGALKYTNTG
jgi:hypothetical protein